MRNRALWAPELRALHASRRIRHCLQALQLDAQPAARADAVLTRIQAFERHVYVMQLVIDRFPRRIKLGIRAVGWIESEVESWIRERAEHSGNDMRTETR